MHARPPLAGVRGQRHAGQVVAIAEIEAQARGGQAQHDQAPAQQRWADRGICPECRHGQGGQHDGRRDPHGGAAMHGGQQLGTGVQFKRRAAGEPKLGEEDAQRGVQRGAGKKPDIGLCRKVAADGHTVRTIVQHPCPFAPAPAGAGAIPYIMCVLLDFCGLSRQSGMKTVSFFFDHRRFS